MHDRASRARYWAAAARAAAALFISALLCIAAPRADAAVVVRGLPAWLASAAERSLGAVVEHISPSDPVDVKKELITVVASRLLRGYDVSGVDLFGTDAVITLASRSDAQQWTVKLSPPPLTAPVDGWFARDADGLADEVAALLTGVPVDALFWGDLELKSAVAELSAPRLPGWGVSLTLRSASLGAASSSTVLEVAFVPEQPLTLAITPKMSSTSVPVLLHSRLKEDLIKGFAPVVGIPVPWLDRHADDLARLTKDILADEYLVEKGKIVADVGVTTGSVSALDIELESRRYSAWVWLSVYAGARDRYPEAGVHFGRKVVPFSGWEVELYGEFIMSLDAWNLETRLGFGWRPLRTLWIGAEWSSDEDLWWARAILSSNRAGRPYLWGRYSEDGDTNAAVGLRVTDYLSLEIVYDSRYDDKWNVRALINL